MNRNITAIVAVAGLALAGTAVTAGAGAQPPQLPHDPRTTRAETGPGAMRLTKSAVTGFPG